MSSTNRLIGSILLVSGTTIGAAMLALPVTTGLAGFFPALAIMTVIWLLMLFTALYMLEVNLRFKGEPNLISMVKKTLHGPGEAIAWVVYLLLLYALIAAYMVGSSQILADFFSPYLSWQPPLWSWAVLIFFLFAAFIYFGTAAADFLNRILMILLGVAYVGLIIPGFSHIEGQNLLHHDFSYLLPSIAIVATTFGYHIIIPTLTTYLDHDVKKLKQAIVIGSIIPFVVYILWMIIVMGVVPVQGEVSLTAAAEAGGQVTFYFRQLVDNAIVHNAARFFALFAIITSLLGVSLSLSDFLTDGLKIKRKSVQGKIAAVLLTFIPPLIFALFYPQGFVLALRYAGIFVVILLALLPTLMVLIERMVGSVNRTLLTAPYSVPGGKAMLFVIMGLSVFLLLIEIFL